MAQVCGGCTANQRYMKNCPSLIQVHPLECSVWKPDVYRQKLKPLLCDVEESDRENYFSKL